MIYLDNDLTVLLPIIAPLISQDFNLAQCFENSIDKLKRRVSRLGMMMLTTIWLLSCQIISQAFVSMILSWLFLTRSQPVVETVEDLVNTHNIRIFHPFFDKLNEYFIEFKPKIYVKLYNKIIDDSVIFEKYRQNMEFLIDEHEQLVRKISTGEYVMFGDEEINIQLLINYKTNPNLFLSRYKYNFVPESISLGRSVGNFKMIRNMYEIFLASSIIYFNFN